MKTREFFSRPFVANTTTTSLFTERSMADHQMASRRFLSFIGTLPTIRNTALRKRSRLAANLAFQQKTMKILEVLGA
jgi:hypothetical protein